MNKEFKEISKALHSELKDELRNGLFKELIDELNLELWNNLYSLLLNSELWDLNI